MLKVWRPKQTKTLRMSLVQKYSMIRCYFEFVLQNMHGRSWTSWTLWSRKINLSKNSWPVSRSSTCDKSLLDSKNHLLGASSYDAEASSSGMTRWTPDVHQSGVRQMYNRLIWQYSNTLILEKIVSRLSNTPLFFPVYQFIYVLNFAM